ncbi:hypothetical protein R3P38DRAFT_2843401 [Favolaschia claudopus]|uniref:BTB domain-containing protein n=1 Tax=Favolaschia claudopus TaxID=2862362 RepID=A0AAW0E1V7_9AGAR
MALPPSQTSERFCASDADLTVRSSDGVLFKVHRMNLKVHSEIFSNASDATIPENTEVVDLTESSDVLDLLFQYMYRQPQPNLKPVQFRVLLGLAEAAEKYVVYSALPAIMIQMHEQLPNYPLHILNFGARHNHRELANEAARLSVGLPISDAAEYMTPDTFKRWIKFYDSWHSSARVALFQVIQTANSNRYTLAQCIRDPQLCYKYGSTLGGLDEYEPGEPRSNAFLFLSGEFMPNPL